MKTTVKLIFINRIDNRDGISKRDIFNLKIADFKTSCNKK